MARDRLQPVPALDGDRGRVGLLVHRDAVGERGEVLVLPGHVGLGVHRARRGQAQRAGAVHQPGHVLRGARHPVEPGAGDQGVDVCDLGLERGELGVRGRGHDPVQQRRRRLQPPVHDGAPGDLDAEEHLLVGHRQAHEVVLLAGEEVLPPERAPDVGQAPRRVAVEGLRPPRDREGTGGHAQVAPAALQLAELVRDAADQRLALGVRPEAPGLRGEPVPGGDGRAGARDVAVDRAQRDGRAVRRGRRRSRQGPAPTASRRSGAQPTGAGPVVAGAPVVGRRGVRRRGGVAEGVQQVVVARPRPARRRAPPGGGRGRPRPGATGTPGRSPTPRARPVRARGPRARANGGPGRSQDRVGAAPSPPSSGRGRLVGVASAAPPSGVGVADALGP